MKDFAVIEVFMKSLSFVKIFLSFKALINLKIKKLPQKSKKFKKSKNL
jgi:hypothetical protein